MERSELDRIEILGVGVDRVDMASTLETIRGYLAVGGFHLVITADASGIVQANEDPELMHIYNEAALVTPDGAGLLWASKKFGRPLVNRVSGVDLVEQLCALSAQSGAKIFFLGAAPGVAQKAAEQLSAKYPGAQIVGARDGFFKQDQDEVVAREIAEYQPDILLVAMGIPRQEKFLVKTKDIIRPKVAMGVGGSFDVHSGMVRRAPVVMQKMKLEWLWRLLQNPKKISKVKLLPIFAKMVFQAKRK